RGACGVRGGEKGKGVGMVWLREIALLWYWARLRPGLVRQGVALAAMAASVLVLMATGSRSAFLGLAILGILLQTGPSAYRIPAAQLSVLVAVAILAGAVLVPREGLGRMIRFKPGKGPVGARPSA